MLIKGNCNQRLLKEINNRTLLVTTSLHYSQFLTSTKKIIDNRYGCHQMWPIMTRLTPMKEKWCKLESPIKLELLQTTLSVLSVSTLAACVTLSIIALNRNLQKQFDAVIMCLILWESIDAASYAISIWDYVLISLSIIYIKLFIYKRWLSFLHWIDGH